MDRNASLIASLRAALKKTASFRTIVESERRLEVTGLPIEARALLLAAMQEATGRRTAIITAGDAGMADLETALRLFHQEANCVAVYPAPTLSPYQDVAPSLGVAREEIRALGMLIDQASDILIVPARALFQRLPRPEAFRRRIIKLAEGEELDLRVLLEALVDNGFVRTDLVGEAGEFAFRGGILDLFPPNTQQPLRVELFGDTIESLRWFDVETQRSEDAAGAVTLYPLTQFPMTRETRSAVARRLSLDFMDPLYKRDVAEKIERLNENGTFPGVEHYIPAATDSVSFAEYLTGWDIVLTEPDQIATTIAKYETLLRTEYEAASENARAVYPPEKLVTPGIEIHGFIGSARVAMSEVHIGGPPRVIPSEVE
ncbi:MAG TPA: hypothetical protein VF698_08210, partial [Thermoanaerobaculia bacterium]